MTDRKLTWSYGGGTQSIAIAILIYQGKLPKPEYIGIADTSRERSSTWEYLDRYVQPMLNSIGLSVEVIPHSYAHEDLYSNHGKIMIPVYFEKSMSMNYCSHKWKKYVFRRRLRELGYRPKNPVITWIGFSKEEFRRVKPSGVQWQEYQWPLIYDIPTTREECKKIVTDFGFPSPPKSSCWMCPFMKSEEWLEIRNHYPKDFEKAIDLEDQIREKEDLYLFYSGISLKELQDIPTDQWKDYVKKRRKEEREVECEEGYCFI